MPLLTAAPQADAITPGQRRTLAAASLGWMLDAFDVMLYAVVLSSVARELGMTKATAGMLNTLTLSTWLQPLVGRAITDGFAPLLSR